MASLQQQQQQQHQQQVSNNNNPTTMMNATATATATDPSTSASTAAIAIASFACEYDPELSPIPDQQAWVVLDLYGNIIRSSISSSSSSSSSSSNNADLIKDVPTLYKMIVESTSLVLAGSGSGSAEGRKGLKRMTITFDNNNNADNNNADNNNADNNAADNAAVRYIIAHDIYHIYIIQTLVVSQ